MIVGMMIRVTFGSKLFLAVTTQRGQMQEGSKTVTQEWTKTM